MATANALMISEFFAGIDLRAELPGLRAIGESRRPDIIVRESWEFGSTLARRALRNPDRVRGAGARGDRGDMTIELAAPKLDEARAALGLPPDPAGERLPATRPTSQRSPRLSRTPPRRSRHRPDPSLPIRHRRADGAAAPRMVAGRPRSPRLPDFRLSRLRPASPLLPRPLYREAIEALSCSGSGAGARNHRQRCRQPPRGARPAPAQRPHRALGPPRRRGVAGDRDRLPRRLRLHARRPRPRCSSGGPAAVQLRSMGQRRRRRPRGRRRLARRRARYAALVLGLPSAETLGGLGRAVENVLDDPVYRREAQRLADAMAALPPIDDSVETLEATAATARASRSS